MSSNKRTMARYVIFKMARISEAISLTLCFISYVLCSLFTYRAILRLTYLNAHLLQVD